MKYIYDAESR